MNPNTNVATTSASGFSFGAAATTAPIKPLGGGGIQFGAQQPTSTAAVNPTPIFSTGSLVPNPTTSATSGSATIPAVSSTVTTIPKPTAGLGFTIPATTASIAPTDASKTLASLTTNTTTTPSTISASATQLNFCQLEEHNNKWIVKLEDQEKIFINHATEINSWDKLLNINNNKIIELSQAVEKVKIEQQALEQELEVISAHHTELDEVITPLQKELSKLPHTDIEKAQTYTLAESLDTQLRQMSKDLKEVIEHLNETNKVQDASDPIVQIGQILNAHVSSMHWIETSISQVASKIDEISKIYDTISRDSERSIRLAYNN